YRRSRIPDAKPIRVHLVRIVYLCTNRHVKWENGFRCVIRQTRYYTECFSRIIVRRREPESRNEMRRPHMVRFPKICGTGVILVAAAALVISIGRAEKPAPAEAKPPAQGVARFTPKPFFEGPTERLGRQINWNTACYKVEYSGDALPIKLEMVE